MDWKELAEDFWNGFKDRIYYIGGIAILVLFPFLIETLIKIDTVQEFPPLPILSNIYALGRDAGLFSSNTYILSIISLCAIWAIFAASWDLLTGYTGQVSFGHAMFWGLAAYCTYWIATWYDIDPIIALLCASVAAAIFALFVGLIALRLKGFYFAIVTMIIPLIAGELVLVFRDLTGGDFGIPNVPSIIETVGKDVLNYREIDALHFYILTVTVFLISVGVMMLIGFSRIGLAFQSIREDEDAAESLGINVRNYKILAFTLSAFFAGIAGGMFSQWLDFTGKSLFDSSFSFGVIIMVVVGGVGSIAGGVIGAFLLTVLVNLFLIDVFQGIHGLDILAYGVVLVITLRFMPYGLARATKEQKKACVLGILFALSWALITSSDLLGMLTSLSTDNILTFLSLLIMLVLTIPAIPVFVISEIVGIFVLEGLLGMGMTSSALIKAKFLIYCTVGIPFTFYLPKIFKILRLRYWGIWPSAGRYEPD